MKKMVGMLKLIVLGCCVVIAGCTSGVGSTSDNDSSGGSAGVSGTVLVSASDLTQIGIDSNTLSVAAHISAADSIGIRNATQLPSGTGEIYVINSDGTVTYTGKSFTVTDGQFSITGLDPEKMYVVEIKALGTRNDGQEKAVVLRAPVVFDESGQASIVVSETSKIVTDYFLTKVVVLGASQIDSEVAQSLQEEIVDTYIEKLVDGDVQRVSPVVDADDLEESVVGVKKDWNIGNEERTIVEAVDDSDSVRKLKDQSVLESKVKGLGMSQGSIEDAKYVVRKIFGAESGGSAKDGGDNGPPEFFIQQFAEAALRNVDVSILDFATAINDSLTNEELKNTYWTVPALQAMMTHSLASSTSNVTLLYQKYSGASPNASVDAYMSAVFPKGALLPLSTLSSSQKLTVFQALYVIKQIGLVDGHSLPDEVLALMGQDGPPFDPYKLLNKIKFVQMSANTVYITESRVTPVMAYKPNGGSYELVPAIEAQVGIFGTNLGAVTKVVLEYPRGNGQTGTTELVRETNQHSSAHSVRVSSVSSAQKSISSRIIETMTKGIREFNRTIRSNDVDELAGGTEQRWRISPWMDNGGYIEDYVSGMATLKVLGAGNQVLETQQIRLIRFDASAISFISPRGMDMREVEAYGWDRSFEPQVFPVDESGKIRPLIAWNPPTYDGELPEGTMLAYSVNLGLSVTKIHWGGVLGSYPGVNQWDHEGDGYRYKNLWSSWQEGRFLVATSVQLKNELGQTVSNIVANYEGSYEVNVAPLLVDKRTGQVVWQGKDSRTSFKVGNVVPWSVALNGRVTFSQRMAQAVPRDSQGQVVAGTWKIGVFQVGKPSNTGWTDLFFNNGSKAPLQTRAGLLVSAALGTTEEIAAEGWRADYTLPSFGKADVEKNSSYRLIVWYDVSQTPDSPNWTNRTAVVGSVDVSTSTHLEFFDMGMGDLWVDQRGMKYSSHNGGWLMITDNSDNQKIDLTVGAWLK